MGAKPENIIYVYYYETDKYIYILPTVRSATMFM